MVTLENMGEGGDARVDGLDMKQRGKMVGCVRDC